MKIAFLGIGKVGFAIGSPGAYDLALGKDGAQEWPSPKFCVGVY